ncbi:large conductance mechanosensitive channel [Aequitasia blattaphilus]
MPIVTLVTGGANFQDWQLKVGGATISYGNFLSEVINFILMALVIFIMIKLINRFNNLKKNPAPEVKKDTKVCPYCLSTIPLKAVKCPECTADLPQTE